MSAPVCRLAIQNAIRVSGGGGAEAGGDGTMRRCAPCVQFGDSRGPTVGDCWQWEDTAASESPPLTLASAAKGQCVLIAAREAASCLILSTTACWCVLMRGRPGKDDRPRYVKL